MTAPTRTDQQRREALLKANKIRTARAELKRLLKTDRSLDRAIAIVRDPRRAALELGRELEPAVGFRAPGDFLDTMPVVDLLLACPAVGGKKARALMVEAWGRLTVTSRRLGGMTPSHRYRLAEVLERFAARRLDYRRPANTNAA